MAGPYTKRFSYRYLPVCFCGALLVPAGAGAQVPALDAPPGFRVETFARGLAEPWGLAFSPEGRLYASLRATGQVVQLTDGDGDGLAEAVTTVVEGLAAPTGLAIVDRSLWIVDASRVLRLDGVDGDSAVLNIILDGLPESETPPSLILLDRAGSEFLLSVGAACEACMSEDPRRAALLRFVIGDTVGQVWARGLQRVTALSVNPQTGELWAADAGRGDLGADVPTGELNILSRGRHYGWPYCHGPRVPAPEYSDPRRCDATERPVHLLPAGSAPAGLLLYAGDAFPASYRGDAFVALTGPAPRIGRLRLAAGRPAVLERFVSGWADAGYPQTLAVAPDGSLYVTDPRGGRIWRVFYTGESRQP